MDILFLHPNMPGQFKHLAAALAAENTHRIRFITKHLTTEMEGVGRVTYRVPRDASPHTHRYLINAERAVLQGQEVWRVAKHLRESEGFSPQIIIAHPGWGDALFIKDLFPKAQLLSLFEFYYHASGADMGFDPEDPIEQDDFARSRIKNTVNILSLEAADWGVCPTVWQWSTHPPEFMNKLSVLHEGIDTQLCKPNPNAIFHIKNGPSFKVGDEVITHIERNFEPYRGFPTFMQMAATLLRERPNAHIVVVGADGVSYGKPAPKGTSYRKIWLERTGLANHPDRARLHFVGTLPHAEMITLLQVSTAHIYLTYPFVLSWSLLEAMACGCAIVASDTKPVREVMEHGTHGLLADFYDPASLAAHVITFLEAKDRNKAMREAARERVLKRYDSALLLPLYVRLVKELAEGIIPPPVASDIAAISEPQRLLPDIGWTP